MVTKMMQLLNSLYPPQSCSMFKILIDFQGSRLTFQTFSGFGTAWLSGSLSACTLIISGITPLHNIQRPRTVANGAQQIVQIRYANLELFFF